MRHIRRDPRHPVIVRGTLRGLLPSLLLFVGGPALGFPDDVAIGYDASYTPEARFFSQTTRPQMLRQTFFVEMGLGDVGLGVRLHDAERLGDPERLGDRANDPSEFGVMLTGTYSPVLSDYLRMEMATRIGLTHGTSNPNQPLFATDTDLSLRLVAFDPVGLGSGLNRIFLSGHAGGMINWVGRTQVTAGGGLWWRQLGLYATGFYTILGLDRPRSEGSIPENAFARVKLAEFTVAFSWDIDLGADNEVRLELRQSIPLENGGFTGVFAVQWRFSFADATEESFEAAW